MAKIQGEEVTKVRWWLVITFSLLGVVVLIAAALVAYGYTSFRGDDASFWSGLLVNIGTSLLLAAVLIWFERAIVRKVQEQTRSTVQRVEQAFTTVATTAATDAASKTAAALQPQLEDLDARIRARSETQASERTATAAKVGEVPSFDVLRSALRVASDINALGEPSFFITSDDGGEVVVPAGEALDSPLVVVTYLREFEDRISLAHLVDRTQRSSVTWQEGQAPEEVFTALKDAMVKDGFGAAARTMSVERLFGNLGSLLTDATSARQADEGAWLSGARVREMVSDGYVITDAGIEVRGHGIAAEPTQFGRYEHGKVVASNVPTLGPNPSDLEVWGRAVARGKGYFTVRPFGLWGAPGTTPF